jgi:transcriptional regulator with XRE-family HTH domain
MKPIYHDLRTYRKQSIFTQQDIADLLGTKDVAQISRYETNPAGPQLELALLYHILFQIPLSDFFPNQKQMLIKRLRMRIPNIINELKCMDMSDIINKKISCLQDVLTAINNEKHL